MVLNCPHNGCSAKFTRQYNLNRHYEKNHLGNEPVEKCFICGQIFRNCQDLQTHFQRCHKPSRKFIPCESAFKKSIVTLRYTFPEIDLNFSQSQHSIKNLLQKTILNEAARRTVCKVSLVFVAQMSMIDFSGEKLTTAYIPFRSPSFNATPSNPNGITQNILKSFSQQAESLEQFLNNGSNWHFDRAFIYNIELSSMRPIVAGGDFNASDLNILGIKNNKELFNPPGKEKKCFLYCIAQALYGENLKKLKEKKTVVLHLKKHFKQFKTDNISFPISIKGVRKFLKINPNLDLKINILFADTNGQVFPYENGLGSGTKTVNLLMVQKQNSDDSAVNHFLLIKNLNRFLRKSYLDKKNKKQYQNAFFCVNCLNHFHSSTVLNNHQKLCFRNKPRVEQLPENSEIKFKNHDNTQKLDYIAFVDFECVLPNVSDVCKICENIKCICDASYTDVLTKQKAIGYSFVVLDSENEIIHEKSYYGKNANEHFIKHLLKCEEAWVKNILTVSQPMDITPKEEKEFLQANCCYMCDKVFDDNTTKCRDHSHKTAKYVGAACQSCNLRRRRPKKLKIFAHNGSR